MERLRTTAKLKLCISPLHDITFSLLKLCYLNVRSLHKHIEDIRKDLIYLSADINIFTETRFNSQDNNDIPAMDQGLMVVQLCTVKSHTYLDTPIVTIYMVLK